MIIFESLCCDNQLITIIMIKSIIKGFVFLSAAMLLFGCKEKEAPYIKVNEKDVYFESAAGEKTVSFTSNLEAISTTYSSDWLTAASGAAVDGILVIKVTENKGLDPRSTTITIGNDIVSETISVTQAGAGAELTLNKSSENVPAEGATFTFSVSSNADWTVALLKDCKWMTADPRTGEGNGSVTVTVEANTAPEAREADIVVRTTSGGVEQHLLVKQEAAAPKLTLDKTAETVPADGGSVSVAVSSNTSWKVELPSGCDWISASPKSGEGDGTVTLMVVANTAQAVRDALVAFVTTTGGVSVDIAIKQEAAAAQFAPFTAKWEFSSEAMAVYKDNFGGESGKLDKAAGDGGCFVDSNISAGGRLTYVQVDKTSIDTGDRAKRTVGSTGHPYVTGTWPGDYWLFTLSNGEKIPAGTTAHIRYITRVSKTGPKYWVIEYLDGNDWKPAGELKTADDVQHNLVMESDGSTNVWVDFTWKTTVDATTLQFRQRIVSGIQATGKAAPDAPNGGTSRIAGSNTPLEDGTGTSSPVFEVL